MSVKTGYIVYACPLGPFAEQLEGYFARVKAEVGPNTAHDYMPHCTLTGFYQDEANAVEVYRSTLGRLQETFRANRPQPPIRITDLLISEKFHGFELSAPELQLMIADFARRADTPTRQEDIRCKDWLHLSLAYNFPAEKHEALAKIARDETDINADVSWVLRFYERLPDTSWLLHGQWPL